MKFTDKEIADKIASIPYEYFSVGVEGPDGKFYNIAIKGITLIDSPDPSGARILTKQTLVSPIIREFIGDREFIPFKVNDFWPTHLFNPDEEKYHVFHVFI